MQVITTHFNADFDCLASMLAAKKLYPDARLIFPGSQEKNVRDFFKFSDIPFSFDRLKNFPIDEIDILIVVDTQMKERIGRFGDVAERPGVAVHVYDHHAFVKSDLGAEKRVVRERGSTATIMVEILKEKGIDISADDATIMALGIYEDTACLTATSTSREDLGAVEFLLSKGANLSTVSDFINREMTADQVWLLNELLRSLETRKVNGVEVNIATASTDSYIGELALLTHKIKDMKNLNLLFSLVRMGDRICMVARSRIEAVDVAEVAAEFGGGGHPTAASATIRELPLVQARERLLEVIRQKIPAVDEVREAMSTPAKVISLHDSISDAKKIMTLFELNALPVVDKDNRPVGIINREIVEKAIHHQMETEKVEAFMSGEISTLHAKDPFRELSFILLEKKQTLVPVVDLASGAVTGVVTRGDLLHGLYGDSLKKPGLIRKGEGTRFPYSRSVKGLLKDRTPERINNIFKLAGEVSDKMGYNVFVVGGFVRDLLLRIKNLDVDLVVEGNGIAFANQLGTLLNARVHYHKRFGTAVLTLPDGFKIDVATARMECYEYPGALPNVEWGSIRRDLLRRDFTINTLAIKLNGNKAYRLLDFFGGQKDLKEKAVRVLHNLSFVEDPTRLFRAIRFEQRFNFGIGKQTLALLKNAVQKNLLERLSDTRLLNELLLMFKEKEPYRMVRRMASLDLPRFIHPMLKATENDLAFMKKVSETLVWYDLLYTGRPVKAWLVLFMALFRGLTGEALSEASAKLGIKEQDREIMAQDKGAILEAGKVLSSIREPSAVEIYKVLNPLPTERLLFLMASLEKEAPRRRLSGYITRLKEIRAEISGRDLIELGLKPGPGFKEMLDAVLYAKVEGRLKSLEDEINFVKERFLYPL